MRAAGGSPSQNQLTVEDVFWNATILHTTDMTQPSQSALSKQSVHSGKTSTRQDISVGYFVLPGYSQDTADASQVECVEPSLLPGICSLHLAAIQQGADHTVIVDCHLCLDRQLGACPHSSRETARVEAAFPFLLLISASKERLLYIYVIRLLYTLYCDMKRLFDI